MSPRKFLLGCLVVNLLGATAAVVGCSASGGGDEEPVAVINPTQPGATVPTPKRRSDDSDNSEEEGDATVRADGGRYDGSAVHTDGGDGGIPERPAPEIGDTCPIPGARFKRTCGKCGSQQAFCLASMNGSGVGKVTDYDMCANETGQCTAGETRACGNCGTQTCSQTCGWLPCDKEPTDPTTHAATSCSPAVVSFETIGCPIANTYRTEVCSATCTYGAPSATCSAVDPIAIPPSGHVSTTQWEFQTTKVGKRPASCYSSRGGVTDPDAGPPPAPPSLTEENVVFVPFKNTTNAALTVSIYHSGSGASTEKPLDTYLWVYNTNAPVTTDPEIRACAGKVHDVCDIDSKPCLPLPSGGADYAGVDNVVVPAGGTIYVYSSTAKTNKGKFSLNVATK